MSFVGCFLKAEPLTMLSRVACRGLKGGNSKGAGARTPTTYAVEVAVNVKPLLTGSFKVVR
jgi:hypothetical protein